MPTQNNASTATHVADSKMGQFFIDQLQDIYWAEQHLVKTLQKLEDAATIPDLKQAFNKHLGETRQHVSRLEQVFEMMGEDVSGQKCKAMAGIIDEGADIIDDTEKGTMTRDAALIFAAQKAEHYEIATYGSLVEIANCLGQSDIANMLEQTLNEEKKADDTLTMIGKNKVNGPACKELND